MQIEADEPEIIERVAALDVGKAEVVCCARVLRPRGQLRRRKHRRAVTQVEPGGRLARRRPDSPPPSWTAAVELTVPTGSLVSRRARLRSQGGLRGTPATLGPGACVAPRRSARS